MLDKISGYLFLFKCTKTRTEEIYHFYFATKHLKIDNQVFSLFWQQKLDLILSNCDPERSVFSLRGL